MLIKKEKGKKRKKTQHKQNQNSFISHLIGVKLSMIFWNNILLLFYLKHLYSPKRNTEHKTKMAPLK